MEHRLTDRLLAYWNTLKKDAEMPDYNHFNASSINDIWSQCILFEVQPGTEGKPYVFSFQRVGEKVQGIYSADMVGRSFNTNERHFPAAAIVRKMDETISSPTSLVDMGQFINEASKMVKYRSCLLPFGRDGRVTHVIVALTWRQY